MARLDGRVALITGAAGGIGAAAARLFVEEGASLCLVDRDQDGLSALTQSLDNQRAISQTADVADSSDMRACVDAAVKAFGGLDIAILNAGIEGELMPIADYPEDDFDRVIAINLKGVWLGLKHAMPALETRGGGSIVITSSIAGVRGRAGMWGYTASKHGVVGLMRTAALEGAPAGIRVNSVHPSPVETRMMRSLESKMRPDDPEGARVAYRKVSPLGRYAEPEEVAKMMLFLAGDDSSHCTGSTFMIDGGRSAG